MYGGQPTAKRFLIITPGSLVKVDVTVLFFRLACKYTCQRITCITNRSLYFLYRTGLRSFVSGWEMREYLFTLWILTKKFRYFFVYLALLLASIGHFSIFPISKNCTVRRFIVLGIPSQSSVSSNGDQLWNVCETRGRHEKDQIWSRYLWWST